MFAKRAFSVIFALMLAMFLGACGGGQDAGQSEQKLSGEVKIAGSSTVYPISTAVAEEYSKRHAGVDVSVSSTGTGGGFENFFCEGKTDINDASRPIKDSEVKACRENGVEPIELRVATDALTVVVNNDNDWAQCMTVEELRTVWRPEDPARTWSDVRSGWPNKEIELYGAASTSGTFDYFTETVIGEEDAHRSDYQPTEHDNVIVQAVSGSKHAMGYFGFAYYSQNTDRVKAVAVDDGNGCVKPSLQNAQDGDYTPLSRPLFIYVSKASLQNKKQVRDFVRYYLEKTSTKLIEQVGYVPVNDPVKQENLGKLEAF